MEFHVSKETHNSEIPWICYGGKVGCTRFVWKVGNQYLKFWFKLDKLKKKKLPIYGTHWISQPMRIEELIQEEKKKERKIYIYCGGGLFLRVVVVLVVVKSFCLWCWWVWCEKKLFMKSFMARGQTDRHTDTQTLRLLDWIGLGSEIILILILKWPDFRFVERFGSDSVLKIINRPCVAGVVLQNTFVIHSLIKSSFCSESLKRLHAQTAKSRDLEILTHR